MSDLCREYGISRKTGHKIWNRFQALGIDGLRDESRAPHRIPHRTRDELVELIVAERKKHPTWGAKKLKDVIERRDQLVLPSESTVGDILKRAGLVTPRRERPKFPPRPTGLRSSDAPNQVWSADYKGQFRLGDGKYCYPLTVTDHFTRFIIGCDAMDAISDHSARDCFLTHFQEYGLPETIRTDNGVPFACHGLASLTRLSVLWLRLGIEVERIAPGHPEQNGRHERMHRTLKRETTRPAAKTLLQQQERFDAFVEEYNEARPHESLAMKRPGEVFVPSARRLPSAIPEPSYPLHDDVLRVSDKGYVHLLTRTTYVGRALSGELLGLREEDDGRFLLSFLTIDLGHVSADGKYFTAIDGRSVEKE